MRYLFILIVSFTLLVSFTNAAEYRSNESVYLEKGDTLNTDLFAGARNVEIEGTLNGDAYVGCQHLRVTGEVADDVIAGCQILSIHNKVGDQVVGFAEQIIIDSEIGGDVLAWGGQVRITKNAHIKGNLFVGTGDFKFEGGQIDGDINGGAGEAFLNGSVGGQVELGLGSVKFGEEYNAINGTLLKLHDDLAEDTKNIPANLEITITPHKRFFQGLFFYWSMIAMFVVGLLLVTIFKNFSRDLVNYGKEFMLKNTGIGFIVLVATPIVAVILAVLIITIPVSLILIALYLILLYLSSVIAGLFVGDYIVTMLKKNGKSTNLILSLLVGIILISLISKVPFIGWLFSLLFICFGLGTIVLYIFQLSKSKQQTA